MNAVILRPGQAVRGKRGGLFRVAEWAGEGSYARVYRVDGPGGCAALKLAKREVSGAEGRLLREEEAAAHFAHPALPVFIDSGSVDCGGEGPSGAPWIARRWVDGATLRQRLERDRSFPLARTVPVLLRLADVVAALHSRGWCHGDLRPDNIMLEAGTAQVFLLDLGAARPLNGGEIRAGRTPGVQPAREAPAGVRGTVTMSSLPCTDLRQLGDLLAWCLTGRDPAVDPDRLSVTAGYHPDAVRIWQEARMGRLQSAAHFRDHLQRLAGKLQIRA